MAKIENAEQQFHQILRNHIKQGDIEDNFEIVFNENTDFYELCKKYADVGLNAQKRKSEDGLHVEGSFQFKDLDNAVTATINFIHKHEIINIDELFEIIKVMHLYAVDWDDKRSRSVTLLKDDNNRYLPQVGNYTVFSKLPEDVFNMIKETVITGKKNW